MGNVLYRKYRSQSLAEIIGQPHITTTLQNALENGRIAHAYLFTGPRGVGKTSIARILAREVNKLSVKEADNHLDIIEIDAASNRRIDEIRELRDKVHNAPAQATYKVYIIDEVHMLTKEAFNALLKTLEEPPEHAIFILATTEVHKLPDTIVSRTQKFTFRPVEVQQVVQHLKYIADTESIPIADDALELIARHGQGSFRDSISLLDQIRHIASDDRIISAKDIAVAIGAVPTEAVDNLRKQLESSSPGEILQTVDELCTSGYSPAQIASQMSIRLRDSIMSSGQTDRATTELLGSLSQVAGMHDTRIALEVALLEYRLPKGQQAAQRIEQQPATPKAEQPAPTAVQATPKAESPKEKQDTPSSVPKSTNKPSQKPAKDAQQIHPDNIWKSVLNTLKGSHNTLYGMARMAIPAIDGDDFILECKYAFHKKRLSDKHHKKILSDAIAEASGASYVVVCTLAEKKPAKNTNPERPDVPDEPAKPGEPLETINNIFGSSEVLDS